MIDLASRIAVMVITMMMMVVVVPPHGLRVDDAAVRHDVFIMDVVDCYLDELIMQILKVGC